MSNWYICVDQGFTNPAAVLLVGCDADQRWHVFREFYKRGLVESEVADQVVAWNTEKQVEVVAVDEAAASLVELLKQRGCHAMGGKGKILDGIYLLQNRMNPVPTDVTAEFPHGRPRLTFDPDCKNTINELESHVWKPEKDIPLDKDNHSIASLRYLEDVVGNTGAFTSSSTIHLPPPTAGAGIRPRFVPRRFVPTRR
jgi:phage terminase large subunit